jgi:hypothetical protein
MEIKMLAGFSYIYIFEKEGPYLIFFPIVFCSFDL